MSLAPLESRAVRSPREESRAVMLFACIALGGALGALARYGVAEAFHGQAGLTFPWGTFLVNASGSFLIGFAMHWLETTTASPELRALVTVGFLGAFTTFSTYSWETVRLLQGGAWLRAAVYAGGSLAVGIIAVIAGIALASLMRTGS